MKKEKLYWYILLASLALTVLFSILTIVYMIKGFSPFSVAALIVEVFVIGVIVYCIMQEKNEMQANSMPAVEKSAEDEILEEFTFKDEAVEEVAEEAPVEEVAEEASAADEAPEEIKAE